MNIESAVRRVVYYTVAWLVLTEGAAFGWLPFAVIAAAVATSFAVQPGGTRPWRLGGLVRFLPFFVWQSFAGGVDVARRALHPRMPIDPAIVEYAVRLPEGPARRFFAAVTGLLPGTLTARMGPDHLTLHVLDVNLPLARTLRMLEDRTADLFGVTVQTARAERND